MVNRFGESVTKYRNKILSWRGPQIPSRYVVDIVSGPDEEPVIFYPESISLPTRAFNVTPFSFWGPDYLIPSRRDYGECAMSFIMWSDNYERKYFERWMNNVITTKGLGSSNRPGIQTENIDLGGNLGVKDLGGIIPAPSELGNPVVNTNEYADVAFPYLSFAGSIGIHLLTEKSQASRWPNARRFYGTNFSTNASFVLLDAYPTTITSTNLAAEANSYGTFVVVFSFRSYEMF